MKRITFQPTPDISYILRVLREILDFAGCKKPKSTKIDDWQRAVLKTK